MSDVQVVVVYEGHSPAECGIECPLVHTLQMMLARVVGRVSLAGEDQLDRSLGRVENATQPLRVGEDELRAFIVGEPSREADGQCVRVEQRAGGQDPAGADPLAGPPLARALADEVEEIAPQLLPHPPELRVRNLEHPVPDRVVPLVSPVRAQVLVEQQRQPVGHPRAHVDAVG